MAILMSALGVETDPVVPSTDVDPLGIVDVRGPLVHHRTFGFDSYDAIVERVASACASPARTVVLVIDSPGGDAHGCIEAARQIRALAENAGKEIVAHVTGTAASAAYALACAADHIYVAATGCIGSIGMIDTMVSVSQQDAKMGLEVVLITSGARKADGNPHQEISDAAKAAAQVQVNDLAGIFWAWVAERRDLTAEQVQNLEASLFIGKKAVDQCLANRVLSFPGLRGTLDANAPGVPQGKQMTAPKASKYTDAMAALAALAEDGDEDAKKAMKKMLVAKAADESEKKDDEPKKEEAKAEAPEKKDDKPAAQASANAAALDLAAEVLSLKNQMAADKVAAERATLLASRPDLTAEPKVKALLDGMPIENLRQAVASLPKAIVAALPKIDPTKGASQETGLPTDESEALKIQMGLKSHPTASVTKTDNLTIFGGTPTQVASRLGEVK